MKKVLGLLVLILFQASFLQEAKACDSCSLFNGVTPNATKNRIGLSFRHRCFSGTFDGIGFQKTDHSPGTLHGISASPDEPVKAMEKYRSLSLYARWFFKPKWNLQVQLPMVYNQVNISTFQESFKGIGDLNAILSYTLADKKVKDHSFQTFVGMGLKLPTGGRFKETQDYLDWFDLQGGSGSFDILCRLDLNWRKNRVGVLSNTIYRINTANKSQIRYGNFLNQNLNLFYTFEFPAKLFQLMPAAGVFAEHFSGRTLEDQEIEDLGGSSLFANFSLNLFTTKVNFKASYQSPLFQKLKGDQLKSRGITNLDVSYCF